MEVSIQELLQLAGGKQESVDTAFTVGEQYLIRCVTFFYTGRVVRITPTELVLEDAAWIASTGRFSTCLKTGNLEEAEPFVDLVIISRGAIVDATVWQHDLPSEQK